MNIALSVTCLYRGGAERVVTNLANALVKKGHEVTILLYRKSERGYTLDDRVKIIFDETSSETVIGHIIFRRLHFQNTEYDVVISFLDHLNIVNIISMIGLKVPLIVASRDDPRTTPEKAYLRCARNYLFRFADKVIVQNQYNLNYFSRQIRKKSNIIYNAVDMKGYEGRALRTEKQDKIVWVGRLTDQKNPQMMLQAFSRFHEHYPKYRLYFYGDGVLKEILAEMVRKNNLNDSVVLKGNVVDIFEQIVDAKLFVMTSNHEGMPNALLEAMCIGLPVICTKVAGAAELIRDHQNGVLIDCNDIGALYSAMRFILTDEEIQKGYACEAIEIYNKLRSEVIVSQWMNQIEDCIGKRGK